jgi:hypothetical protein
LQDLGLVHMFAVIYLAADASVKGYISVCAICGVEVGEAGRGGCRCRAAGVPHTHKGADSNQGSLQAMLNMYIYVRRVGVRVGPGLWCGLGLGLGLGFGLRVRSRVGVRVTVWDSGQRWCYA